MPFEDAMFSGRSILTMVHGLILSGGAMLALAAALFYLYSRRPGNTNGTAGDTEGNTFAMLNGFVVLSLWLSVLVGTYVIFPLYRAAPPEGALDLVAYPRALILADANSAWLHRIGMEIKEHVPWIAAMLATAVAFVAARYKSRIFTDAGIRAVSLMFLTLSLALVSVVALFGTLINKFAPLE